LEDLRRLSADQQERFERVVNRLMGGVVLTPGENPLTMPDADWRFLERHLHLVEGYLGIAGWTVDYHPEHRMARAIHKEGKHRVRFNLLESLVVCILRLAYHEQMAGGGTDEQCEVTTGDLRERIAQAHRTSAAIARTKLAQAIRKLKRYGIVDVQWGYDAEDYEMIRVLPMIEMVLSNDTVHRFFERYANPSGEMLPDADVDVSAEDDEDDSIEEVSPDA
jgi:hypothetical protein